jgi:FHS family L-fucose permease-like MFS transporter
VLFVAILFFKTKLPEYWEKDKLDVSGKPNRSLLSYPHFKGAVVAQFFYVAAQVGVAAFFINYCTEFGAGVTSAEASYLLSISLLLFTIGRFVGTALLKRIEANKLLGIYALINIALCAMVITGNGWVSIYSLMVIFFFESIMFPSIFALGLRRLGSSTKKASSFLIMAIVGGAIIPYAMGFIADLFSTATAFVIPLFCFCVVAWYGWVGYKIKQRKTPAGMEDMPVKPGFLKTT